MAVSRQERKRHGVGFYAERQLSQEEVEVQALRLIQDFKKGIIGEEVETFRGVTKLEGRKYEIYLVASKNIQELIVQTPPPGEGAISEQLFIRSRRVGEKEGGEPAIINYDRGPGRPYKTSPSLVEKAEEILRLIKGTLLQPQGATF